MERPAFSEAQLSTSELLANRNKEESFGATLARSAWYSFAQAPVNGVVQIVDKGFGTNVLPDVQFVAPSQKAEFGSTNWHAQQLGGAVGMLPWFIGLQKGAGYIPGLRQSGALAEAATATAGVARAESFALSPMGKEMTKSALAGLAYGGILSPTDLREQDFLTARLRGATVNAMTFATLSGSAAKLKDLGLKNHIVAGIVSGVPAGFVHAEANSLLSGKGWASGRELTEGIYGFAFVGGTLGAGHQIAAWRGARAEAKGTDKPPEASVVTREVNSGTEPFATGGPVESAGPSVRAIEGNSAGESVQAKPTGDSIVVPTTPPAAKLTAEAIVPAAKAIEGNSAGESVQSRPTADSIVVPTKPLAGKPTDSTGPALTVPEAKPTALLDTKPSPDVVAPEAKPIEPARPTNPGWREHNYVSRDTGVTVRYTDKGRGKRTAEFEEPENPGHKVVQEFNESDFTFEVTRPDGTTFNMKSAGPWRVKLSSGQVFSKDAKGNVELLSKDGSREVELAETGEHYREYKEPSLFDEKDQIHREPMYGDQRKWTSAPPKRIIEGIEVEEIATERGTELRYKDKSNSSQTVTEKRGDGPAWEVRRQDGTTFTEETPGPWSVQRLNGKWSKNAEGTLTRESTYKEAGSTPRDVSEAWYPDGTYTRSYRDPYSVRQVTETRKPDGEGDFVESWSAKGADGNVITPESPGYWSVHFLFRGRSQTKTADGTRIIRENDPIEIGDRLVDAVRTETYRPGEKEPSTRTLEYKDPGQKGQTVTETFKGDDSASTWSVQRSNGTTFNSESPGPWSVGLSQGRQSRQANGTRIFEGDFSAVLDGLDIPEGNIMNVTVRPDGTKTISYDGWFTEYLEYTIRPDGTTSGVYND